jgi:hypothetical protein
MVVSVMLLLVVELETVIDRQIRVFVSLCEGGVNHFSSELKSQQLLFRLYSTVGHRRLVLFRFYVSLQFLLFTI